MSWLKASELQGLATLATMLQITLSIWLMVKKERAAAAAKQAPAATRPALTRTAPVSMAPAHSVVRAALGCLFLLVAGWAFYSVLWALLLLATGVTNPMAQIFSPIFSPLLVLLSAIPALGAFLTGSPAAGGFLGGAFPFGLLGLYRVSQLQSSQQFMLPLFGASSPFAAVVVLTLVGGLVGWLVGSAVMRVAQAARLLLLSAP